MKSLWPNISRIGFCSFISNEKWHFYLWKNEKGVTVTKFPPLTKEWDELKNEANMTNVDNLPDYLIQNPIIFLLFLIVYPHRIRPDVVNWLDKQLC